MQIYRPRMGRFSSRTIRKENPEGSRETSPSRKNRSDPKESRGQDGVSGHRYNTRESISKALKIQQEQRGSREEKEEEEGKSLSEEKSQDILDPQISAGSSRNDPSDQQERSTSSKPEEIKSETKPGEDSRCAEKSVQEWNMKILYVELKIHSDKYFVSQLCDIR